MRQFICLPFLCQAVLASRATFDSRNEDQARVHNAFSKTNRLDYKALPVGSAERPPTWKAKGGGDAQHTLAVEGSAEVATCWGNRSAPVTLLTLAAGLSDTYIALLRANRLAYVVQHGLEYCEYTHVIDPQKEPTWSKVWAILYLLEDPAGPRSRVQWLDADLLITNPNISIIHDVLTVPLASKDAVFSADFPAPRGQVSSRLNAGSMHLRNSRWTRTFLRHLFSTSAGTRSTALSLFDGGYDCEQTALMQARAENPSDFAEHTAVVPWNVMNTLGFSNYCEGDFVVHAAGGGNRLGSFFTGLYWQKWGGVDKYRQLEEFLSHLQVEKATQRLRGDSSNNGVRCGEFVPHMGDAMMPFKMLRIAVGVLAIAGFAVASWTMGSRAVRELATKKASMQGTRSPFGRPSD